MSRQDSKIKAGAQPYLEPDEEVLAALVVAARGHTQMVAGSMNLGAAQQHRAHQAADAAELRLESPMALVLTRRRLMTVKIGTPIGMGIGGGVKELMSAIPLADVEAIDVKRLLLGYKIVLTVRGAQIALEANAAAAAKPLAAAFERAKATVAV